MHNRLKRTTIALALAMAGFAAHADLARVGPANVPSPPGNGFPLWYQDLGGTVLDLCLPGANDPGQLQQTACLLGPPAPNPPYTFPTTFPDEIFYFRAVADPLDMGNGKRAIVVLALEAAFGGGVAKANDQMVFSRIRVTAGVPEVGVYTVTHPYGIETFPVETVAAGNRDITFTEDVGLTVGNFTDALRSRVGPFLMPADALGNPAPFVTLNGAQFLSDGVTSVSVTGSPFGTNYVEICGVRPDGTNIVLGGFGATGTCARTSLFALTGRVHDFVASPIGSPLAINSATYGRDAAGTHVDVYASVVKVLATQPNPLLTAAALNEIPVKMSGPNGLGQYYAQGITDPTGALPGSVTVINSADNPPSTAVHNAVDVVTVASTGYDPGLGTLTVVATSSDKGFGASLPPALVLEGFPGASVTAGGIAGDPAAVTLSVTGLAIPPAAVGVLSAAGGIGRADVAGGQAAPFAPGVVFAQDDSIGTVASGPAVTLPVLANDVVNPAAPFNPTTVTILPGGVTPNIGTATANPDGSVSFTPSALTGVATFRYTVANAVGVSNPATVTVSVAPPAGGPVPIAVADAGPNTVATNGTITINVLANDSGNGGTLDPASVAVVAASVTGGTATANSATGTVSFTAGPSAGTFGFDYTVANTNGNVSAPAHVTVGVITPEQVTVQAGTQCKRNGTLGDWTIRGTSTVSTGNSITVYTTATVPAAPTAAQIIQTVPVVTGAWQVNVRGGKPCTTPVSLQSTLGTKINNIPVTIR